MSPVFLEALALAKGLAPTATHLSRIGRATSPEAARWAFTQWELRKRGAAKFARAHEMLFDRDGLEMASHERLAAYHASRFPEGAKIVEIGCGIGADTIALSRRGSVLAFESDPDRAELARHNLMVHGVVGTIRSEPWTPTVVADYVFADPSRRAHGKRTLEPESFSPDPIEIARTYDEARLVGLKLSPMLPDAFFERFEARLEFVSLGRECREALVWLGSESAAHGTYAVHAESGEVLASHEQHAFSDAPAGWIHEADPAAIRAHALGAFGIASLGDSNGYLTSGGVVESVWLRSYRVLSSGKFGVRELQSALKDVGGGTPEIKQRGTGIDPATLRKQMKLTGTRRVVVLLYPVGKGIRFAVTELG